MFAYAVLLRSTEISEMLLCIPCVLKRRAVLYFTKLQGSYEMKKDIVDHVQFVTFRHKHDIDPILGR
jgi:hypothetical protein